MNGFREQPAEAAEKTRDAPNGLLRARTVCRLLDCSDRTLRRWVDAGKFPPPDRKIGRTLRWRFDTVAAFLQGDHE